MDIKFRKFRFLPSNVLLSYWDVCFINTFCLLSFFSFIISKVDIGHLGSKKQKLNRISCFTVSELNLLFMVEWFWICFAIWQTILAFLVQIRNIIIVIACFSCTPRAWMTVATPGSLQRLRTCCLLQTWPGRRTGPYPTKPTLCSRRGAWCHQILQHWNVRVSLKQSNIQNLKTLTKKGAERN